MAYEVLYPEKLTYLDAGTSKVEEVWYSVLIDMHQVHAMARKAARSSGSKSTDGPLRVQVFSRRRVKNEIRAGTD